MSEVPLANFIQDSLSFGRLWLLIIPLDLVSIPPKVRSLKY